MTLLVRNEEDIIAQNILYHFSQGISAFLVMDNLSTDSTLSILDRLSRIIPIVIYHQNDDTYDQSRWVTAMARDAYLNEGADWVINNDADEFWQFPGGNAPGFLSSVDDQISGLLVRRFNAVLISGGREYSCHPEVSQYFWKHSKNALNNSLPSKCLHRGFSSVTVAQGNHDISGHTGLIELTQQISILHFPYRSFFSYKRKIRLGGDAYARNKDLPAAFGDAWRAQNKFLDSDDMLSFWKDLAVAPNVIQSALSDGSIVVNFKLIEALKSVKSDYWWFWLKFRLRTLYANIVRAINFRN